MKKIYLSALIFVCLLAVLFLYGIEISGYYSRHIRVDIEEITPRDILPPDEGVPFSVLITSGPTEFGFGRGFGDIVTTNNTNITTSVFHPNMMSPKIDSLLYDISFLEEEEYLTDGVVPVIIRLSYCSDMVPTGKSGLQTFSFAKSEVSSFTKNHKADLKSICSISADVEIDELHKLLSVDSVSKIYLDRKYSMLLNESVPVISVDDVWTMPPDGINGTGVIVAVLDTGLNFSHPDFYGKNIQSASFVSGETVDDNHMHGTHCAGIAVGTGNASGGKFTGVAPGSDLMVGKVLSNSGFGYTSWIIEGIEWAVDNGADVISLSLGGASTDGNDPLSVAVDNAVNFGVVVVVAAGNSGSQGPMSVSSPGVSRKAITVGASNKTDPETIASFSSMGPTSDGRFKPEVVAPGVNICSTNALGFLDGSACGNDYYWPLSGTSMAAPHVAGAVALLLQKHNDWTPENIKSALVLTSLDLGESPFSQGSGRVNIYRAINTPILTNPAVLNIGLIRNGVEFIELTITNINDTEIEILIFPSELISVGNFSGNWLEVNESSIVIPPEESYVVSVSADITEDVEGIFYGKLTLEIGEETYHVPVSVSRLSRVFVGVVHEDGTLSKPSFVVLYDHSNFTGFIAWAGYSSNDFNHTLIAPAGNYSLHVFGDLYNTNLNYVLGDFFELKRGEYREYLFNVSESNHVDVPIFSKGGIPLDVYNYEYMVVCYYPTEPKRIRLLHLLWGLGETMDGSLYVSESTCPERSIQIQVRGSPTRGHLYQRSPEEGLYDIPGYEWMWRWENRDISDEDYLLAWDVRGDVTEDITLVFDMNKTSIFKEFYNFAGYAPFTQKTHPQRFMARIVFWLAPDWFESWSFMKRPSAPVNRTLYLMGSGWTYRGYMQVKYPNSTSQSTATQVETPQNHNSGYGIKISDIPLYRTHHFGTPPFQLPYFMNFISSSVIKIRTNAPLIWNEDRFVYISKGYDTFLNPSYYIYRDGVLLASAPTINTHEIWWKGILKDDSAVSSYKVNITLPLKYSVYNLIDIFAEFHGSGSDVNPPSPYNFFVNPSFNYNNPFPVQVDFLEELSSGELYYRTDKQNWVLISNVTSGTSLGGLINVTDGESTNVSIKILATDLAGNNISYTIFPVSVLYRDIYFNLYSNQTSAYSGETLFFNGTVYDPLDPYFSGIKIKYFVNGNYIDFDRTDFNENINTIDLRMQSYQMCVGCFGKNFTVPLDFEEDSLNFTVLFEGSGPYKRTSKSILVGIIKPFQINVSRLSQIVTVGSMANFDFNITNQFEVEDTYHILFNSNVSWGVYNLPSDVEVLSFDTENITFGVFVPKFNEDVTGEFELVLVSNKTEYNKVVTFYVITNTTLDEENYPFRVNTSELSKTVTVGSAASFSFDVTNQMDFNDCYNVTFSSNVLSWSFSGIPTTVCVMSANDSFVDFQVTPSSNINQVTTGEINVSVLSLETMYDGELTFSVTANPQPTGGGTSSGFISTPPVTESSTYDWESEESIEKVLKKSDRITFNFQESQHTITVLSIQADSVDIQIESEPLVLNLKVGETKYVDLNKDGLYDLSIYLEKIEDNSAYLTVEYISYTPEIVEEPKAEVVEQEPSLVDGVHGPFEDTKKENYFGLLVISLIFLFSLVVVAWEYTNLKKFSKK